MGKLWAYILIATCLGSVVVLAEDDAVAPPPLSIVISVAEQKLAVLKDGGLVRKYPISTSKFGLGDSYNSYKTPLGRLRVCDKIGDGLALGSVLKCRNATGEILQANAPGRDPIVTRILWLDGLEAGNAAAKSRGIYIHGTVEESKLGQPVSYGCIRMRSRDVVELFDDTPVGTPVEIITDHFPRFQKAAPRTEVLVAANDGVTTTGGPHGMVIVKTVRGGEIQMTSKDKSPAGRTLFADGKPTTPTAAQPASDKTIEAAAKTLAKSSPPTPPIALGPTVLLKPLPPPEPTVMLSMKGSILDSGLRTSAKTAPAPEPAPAVAPPADRQVAVEVVATLRNMVLQVCAPLDLLAQAKEAARSAPLDHLSAHLLNPPAPSFRLAFRTAAAAPDL